MQRRKLGIIGAGTFVVIGGLVLTVYFILFAPPGKDVVQKTFTIQQGASYPQILEKLRTEGLIKNVKGFQFARRIYPKAIAPGGYLLSGSMNAFAVAKKISGQPDMVWMTFPEGIRKEEMAERIAKVIGWNTADQEEFAAAAHALKAIADEGVYFPDTYLIPRDENGTDVARRMINRFNEKFAPLAPKFLAQNILSNTALRIASIVEREAAGEKDKGLIAGIIWNRLLQDMKLDVDATIQYARGNTGDGWWAPIMSSDKEIESPFNTYKHRGLPPQPISNPGISSIQAVLAPEKTSCLFYLHDENREIHCAKTYSEHRANIEKYLR